MSELEIPRGETKRRSFYSTLVYSAEPPLGWEGEGEGEGGCQSPLPQKGSFCFIEF